MWYSPSNCHIVLVKQKRCVGADLSKAEVNSSVLSLDLNVSIALAALVFAESLFHRVYSKN